VNNCGETDRAVCLISHECQKRGDPEGEKGWTSLLYSTVNPRDGGEERSGRARIKMLKKIPGRSCRKSGNRCRSDIIKRLVKEEPVYPQPVHAREFEDSNRQVIKRIRKENRRSSIRRKKVPRRVSTTRVKLRPERLGRTQTRGKKTTGAGARSGLSVSQRGRTTMGKPTSFSKWINGTGGRGHWGYQHRIGSLIMWTSIEKWLFS